MIKTALFFKKKKEETEETEEEKKKREDDNKHSAKRTMLKSMLAVGAGNVAAKGLSKYFHKKITHDPENFEKVKDYYKNKHKHIVMYSPVSTGGNNKVGGSYSSTSLGNNEGVITHDEKVHDPTMLAHEHGHVHTKGRILPGIFNTPARDSSKIIGAGITAKMSDSKNKWIRRAGVALPLLSTMPHLYEEARASIHAKKGLNELGIKKDVNKKLLSAHGTYSARSLIPAAASTYMNYKIKKRRERLMKEEQEKNEQTR